MKRLRIIGTLVIFGILAAGAASAATYDLTGNWNYQISDSWPIGNPFDQSVNASGQCIIDQQGNTFSFAFISGMICSPPECCTFEGTVSGSEYLCATTDIVDTEGGSVTSTINFTAASPTSASGSGNSVYTHPGGYEMAWGNIIRLTRSESGDGSGAEDDNDGDGYTTAQGDCNDDDNTIHPGAIEICGDGIDQDCDGNDMACGAPWVGDYGVQIQSKLTVKKVGKFTETHNGQLSFAQNGTFEMDDFTTTHDVTGNYSLDPKGKSILFNLTPAGKAALEASLIEWLEAYGLYSLDFSFDKIKTSKVKIDKKTGRATGKIKLDVSGTVSGCTADDECGETKFKYKAMILLVD